MSEHPFSLAFEDSRALADLDSSKFVYSFEVSSLEEFIRFQIPTQKGKTEDV